MAPLAKLKLPGKLSATERNLPRAIGPHLSMPTPERAFNSAPSAAVCPLKTLVNCSPSPSLPFLAPRSSHRVARNKSLCARPMTVSSSASSCVCFWNAIPKSSRSFSTPLLRRSCPWKPACLRRSRWSRRRVPPVWPSCCRSLIAHRMTKNSSASPSSLPSPALAMH